MTGVQVGSVAYRRTFTAKRRMNREGTGDGPPCDHAPDECDVAELWPLDGETHEQFIERLRSYFRGPLSMPMEAQNDGN